MYKIYIQNNYFFIQDSNSLYEGLKKDVVVKIDNTDSLNPEFTFKKLEDWNESKKIRFSQIVDENGDPFADVDTFITFYTENTGNFNGGGTAPDLTNYATIQYVDEKTIFRGAINLSTPSPELSGVYQPTVSGTYTNFGGIVVDLSAGYTTITYDGSVFTKQVNPLILTEYVKKEDLKIIGVSGTANTSIKTVTGKTRPLTIVIACTLKNVVAGTAFSFLTVGGRSILTSTSGTILNSATTGAQKIMGTIAGENCVSAGVINSDNTGYFMSDYELPISLTSGQVAGDGNGLYRITGSPNVIVRNIFAFDTTFNQYDIKKIMDDAGNDRPVRNEFRTNLFLEILGKEMSALGVYNRIDDVIIPWGITPTLEYGLNIYDKNDLKI